MSAETIRPSIRADIPELQRLFAEVFGHDRAAPVWEWKYFDHPAGPHGFVVEAGGRIVAHCGGTAVTMFDGAERYQALQSVDFMSSRRHPGGMGRGGVFVRMVDAFFSAFCGPRKAEAVYGFPGERHRLLGERVLGYRPVERVGVFEAEGMGDAGWTLPPFDESAAARFRAPRFAMGAERDRGYLEWRYARHPVHTYLLVEERRWPWTEPASAIVRADPQGERLLVLEWGGSDDPRTLRRLLGRLRRMGRNVHGWGSVHGSMGRFLAAEGWRVEERDHRLEIRSFTGRHVPGPGELYYSLGDYDVD